MNLKTTRAAVLAIVVAATVPSVINAQEVREPARADRSDDRNGLGLARVIGPSRIVRA